MAGHNLTIGAKFRPFTYDELIKPIQTLTESHYAAEDAMYEMSTNASLLEYLVGEAEDSRSRQMYNTFAQSLREGMEDLYKNGYNAKTRQRLMNARQLYASNVIPLEEAKKQRDTAIAAQRAANAKGNMKFSKYATETSLDDYLNGDFDYTSVDLNDLYTKSTAFGQQFSKRYQNTVEGQAFSGDYLKLVKTVGLDTAQTAEALQEAKSNLMRGVATLVQSGKYPGMSEALASIMEASGASTLNDKDYNDALNSVISGFSTGISYDEDVKIQENWREKAEVSYQNEIKAYREKKRIDAEEANNSFEMSDLDIQNRIQAGLMTDEEKKLIQFKDGKYSIRDFKDIAKNYKIDPNLLYVRNPKTGKFRLRTADEYAKEVIAGIKPEGPMSAETLKVLKDPKPVKERFNNFKKSIKSFGIDLERSVRVRPAKNNNNAVQEVFLSPEEVYSLNTAISKSPSIGTAHGTFRLKSLGETAKNIEKILSLGNLGEITEVTGNEYKTKNYDYKEGSEVVQVNYDPDSKVLFATVKEPTNKGNTPEVKRIKIPITNYLSSQDIALINVQYQNALDASTDASRQAAYSEINRILQKGLNKFKPKDKNESV